MADDPSAPTRNRPARRIGRRGVDPSTGQRVSLRARYARAERRWSDVQGHLPRFLDETTRRTAPTIVELGSRSGVSTVAWLYGCELSGGSLTTVDLAPPPPLPGRPFWTHLEGDDLAPEIYTWVPTSIDVLFIDTSHDYEQTLAELRAYGLWVVPGGVIFLHDTDLERPDGIGPQAPYPVRRAIETYVDEVGLSWVEHPGSYGLGEIPVP